MGTQCNMLRSAPKRCVLHRGCRTLARVTLPNAATQRCYPTPTDCKPLPHAPRTHWRDRRSRRRAATTNVQGGAQRRCAHSTSDCCGAGTPETDEGAVLAGTRDGHATHAGRSRRPPLRAAAGTRPPRSCRSRRSGRRSTKSTATLGGWGSRTRLQHKQTSPAGPDLLLLPVPPHARRRLLVDRGVPVRVKQDQPDSHHRRRRRCHAVPSPAESLLVLARASLSADVGQKLGRPAGRSAVPIRAWTGGGADGIRS
jgi:hypothetical protein